MPFNLRDDLLKDTKQDDVYARVAEKIFAMVDDSKLSEISDTQLEIGFRTIKTKLEETGTDYRENIFGLAAKESQDDEFEQFQIDSRNAKPLMRETFAQNIQMIALNLT